MYYLHCFQCILAKLEEFEEVLAKKEPEILKLEETRMSYFCACGDLNIGYFLNKKLNKRPKINIFGPNDLEKTCSYHEEIDRYHSKTTSYHD